MSNLLPSDSSAIPVHFDDASKAVLVRAAELRGVSVDEYVRAVTVEQAQREVLAAEGKDEEEVRLEDLIVDPANVIRMSPEDQLAFWNALNDPKPLTPAQRRLGRLMRGES